MDLVACESFGVASYVSAPTSPGRATLSSGVYFYSVPTSPTGARGGDVRYNLESEPKDLKTGIGIISSDADGFEFRTNQQLQQQKKKEHKCGDDPSLAHKTHNPWKVDPIWGQSPRGERIRTRNAMAFADELFCNGKVLPLKLTPHQTEDDKLFCNSQIPPLKLPPRLQQAEKGKGSNRSSSSSTSSPRSQSSLLRWPLLCCNLRNEDFDPFLAALEHVMEEKEREVVTSTQKCTKSLSTPRTSPQIMQHQALISREPTEIVRLVSARLVGNSRSSHGGCTKATFRTFSASTEKNSTEPLGQFGRSHQKAKHRIQNFLFSSFRGWVGKKEKLRDHNTTVLRKSNYLRRFSFRSI